MDDKIAVYDILCTTLGKRPSETLKHAALRTVMRRDKRDVARAVLSVGERRSEAAWDVLRDAADLARARLV